MAVPATKPDYPQGSGHGRGVIVFKLMPLLKLSTLVSPGRTGFLIHSFRVPN